MALTPRNPLPRLAEPRDVGAACPHCQRHVLASDQVVACLECGAVHHEPCWLQHDGCGTYDCAPMRRVLSGGQQAEIRITASELDGAVPLPRPARPVAVSPMAYSPRPGVATPGTLNRLAVASSIVALAGLALPIGLLLANGADITSRFTGITTLVAVLMGIVAALLGAIAVGKVQKSGQRGTSWGIMGILLGLADTVGWFVFLALTIASPSHMITLDDFQMDPAALERVQPHIARAMRANVYIESSVSLVGQAIGSGVIVGEQAGETLIVTNRHVVDERFDDRSPSSDLPNTALTVRVIGQLPVAGRVVWVAPDGLDIAVISAPIHSAEAEAVPWDNDAQPTMGNEVFSIGNPQGLGWTHTRGTVSQLRTRQYGARRIGMIQTDTAINPGNSGGGLYDETGNLIGINTWTNTMSEGLSFAISFDSIVHLDPPFARNP